MKSIIVNHVKTSFYLDSVALMRYSRSIAAIDGVEEAALMMGSPSNKEIMAEAGILGPDGEKATGRDLIIGIRTASQTAADKALKETMRLLDQPTKFQKEGAHWSFRTLSAAVKSAPGANLALISVPGEFAWVEAGRALREGLNVMIFSDNVPLAKEVELKEQARELELLVMGPDCGTAIINGVPVAFANKINRGDIGIIGASGTGIQEISCLISQSGGGVSHAIGVGGRDLFEEVGGISTLMALEALDADLDTRHIVLVSKPPSPTVAEKILERVRSSKKGFTICFVGTSGIKMPPNAVFAPTLKAAAESALGGRSISTNFRKAETAPRVDGQKKRVLGFFAGGTLCAEAQFLFQEAGEIVTSNVPILGASSVEEAKSGHLFIDFGNDEYTRGRPHPMIDPEVRDQALAEGLKDPEVGIILVDLVLGYGAHSDPAGHLVTSLPNARANSPLVVASVVGTDEDIQNRDSQVRSLEKAGILVAPSNADAAAFALAWVQTRGE